MGGADIPSLKHATGKRILYILLLYNVPVYNMRTIFYTLDSRKVVVVKHLSNVG